MIYRWMNCTVSNFPFSLKFLLSAGLLCFQTVRFICWEGKSLTTFLGKKCMFLTLFWMTGSSFKRRVCLRKNLTLLFVTLRETFMSFVAKIPTLKSQTTARPTQLKKTRGRVLPKPTKSDMPQVQANSEDNSFFCSEADTSNLLFFSFKVWK